MKVKVAQLCPTPCDPMTIQSMEFSRPEYWSGYPFPCPGNLPKPGTEPRFPALQVDSLPAEPQRKPLFIFYAYFNDQGQGVIPAYFKWVTQHHWKWEHFLILCHTQFGPKSLFFVPDSWSEGLRRKERFRFIIDFPGGAVIKNPPASVGDTGDVDWSLGWEDPLEEAVATYPSVLAWKIPWIEEPVRLQSTGLQRVEHSLATEHTVMTWI